MTIDMFNQPITKNTEDICFAGAVTVDEFIQAYNVAWGHIWLVRLRYFVLVGGIALALAFGAFASRNGDLWTANFFYACAAVLPISWVGGLVLKRYKIRQLLNDNFFSGVGAETVVNDFGVVIQDRDTVWATRWTKFCGYRMTDEIAIYYIHYPRTFIALFKRTMMPARDWRQLKVVTEKRLKEI